MFASRSGHRPINTESQEINQKKRKKKEKKIVYAPQMATTVLEQKGGHWLSPSRMLKYRVILLKQDDVELKVTSAVNPASFFLIFNEEREDPLSHDCLQTSTGNISTDLDMALIDRKW